MLLFDAGRDQLEFFGLQEHHFFGEGVGEAASEAGVCGDDLGFVGDGAVECTGEKSVFVLDGFPGDVVAGSFAIGVAALGHPLNPFADGVVGDGDDGHVVEERFDVSGDVAPVAGDGCRFDSGEVVAVFFEPADEGSSGVAQFFCFEDAEGFGGAVDFKVGLEVVGFLVGVEGHGALLGGWFGSPEDAVGNAFFVVLFVDRCHVVLRCRVGVT